jgi:hypothetical protein
MDEYLKNTTRTNKFNQGNKDNMRETKQNFNKIKNTRYEEITPDLFNIKNPQSQQQKLNNTNQLKNVQLEPLQSMNKKQGNANIIVINRKEAKKYEDLLKNSHNFEFGSPNTNNPPITHPHPHSVNKIKPGGKVILDPINNNPLNQTKNYNISSVSNTDNNKKMEVSFKATLQFTTDCNNNNKIEINPNINLNNPSIINFGNNTKKGRLEKIQEYKYKDELEINDQEDYNF